MVVIHTYVPGFGPDKASPVLKDFSNRWSTTIETLNKEVGMHFAEAACGKDVLQVISSQA